MRETILFCLLFAISSCAHLNNQAPLYNQLGEMEGITKIVDSLLHEISTDAKVLPLFSNTNIKRFRSKLSEQICDISGGPCEYSGDTMEETHRNLNITRNQFNSLVEDLIRAMEKNSISVPAQNELLKRLAKMYPDIKH